MELLTIVKIILANPAVFGLLVFSTTLILFVIGRRLGWRSGSAQVSESLGIVDGAVFALLGLLMAFVFSGAAGRLETRRDLLVEEANAIGTARLRIDLLPSAAQPAMRQTFDHYVAARRRVYNSLDNTAARDQALQDSERLQKDLWSIAIRNPSQPGNGSDSHRMLLPALNSMFDIATTRVVAIGAHLPAPVLLTLWLVTLAASLLAGRTSRGLKSFPWGSALAFAGTMAVVLYLIIDYEYPRYGLIRIDHLDALIK
jgi:hypothetical protein